MEKRIKIIVLSLAVLVLVLTGYVAFLHMSITKIGYVKNLVLLEKYAGIADSKKVLERKMDTWQANVDTLEMNYEKSLDQYNKDYKNLSAKERTDLKANIDKQYENLDSYSRSVEKMAVDENQKLLQGALEQINRYIEKYATDNGYDIILGVNDSGNILFGSEAKDLTNKILEGANKEYSGK